MQYDLFLLSLGNHAPEVEAQLRAEHTKEFFELKHYDSVDKVNQTAPDSINEAHGQPFRDDLMKEAPRTGFKNSVKWPKETVEIGGLNIGHVRATRPNGYDKVDYNAKGWEAWEIWERDENPEDKAELPN